jgi:hypothetical protein
MTLKGLRRIGVAGTAASAVVVLLAAPAGASVGGIGTAGAPASTSATAGSAVATSAAALPAKFGWSVKTNQCFADHQLLTVQQIERGKSGAVRFRQTSTGQYMADGVWKTSGTSKVSTSSLFPNDSRSFTISVPWRYNYGTTAGLSHRIVLKLDWVGSGARVLGTQTIAQNC